MQIAALAINLILASLRKGSEIDYCARVCLRYACQNTKYSILPLFTPFLTHNFGSNLQDIWYKYFNLSLTLM